MKEKIKLDKEESLLYLYMIDKGFVNIERLKDNASGRLIKEYQAFPNVFHFLSTYTNLPIDEYFGFGEFQVKFLYPLLKKLDIDFTKLLEGLLRRDFYPNIKMNILS